MILLTAAGWTERPDMNLLLFEGSMGSKEVETQYIHTKCSRACTVGRYPVERKVEILILGELWGGE